MANGLALFDRIANRDLDVQRIVDPHSPLVATMEDLRRAVAKLRNRPADIVSSARKDLAAWHSADEHVR